MSYQDLFLRSDLLELGDLLSRADHVIPMRDMPGREHETETIGLRHDVDDNPGSLDTALKLAEWENTRGYRSTYYLLHHSHYWPQAGDAAEQLEQLGHEVGIHVNAVAEAIRQQRTPHDILEEALDLLREHATVTGSVAHGDSLCHRHKFVNDEIFQECARPSYGNPCRTIAGVTLDPRPLSDYGLDYDANWLPRGDYLSDSGGAWSQPFDEVAAAFPTRGQLHILQHPDWWQHAFELQEAAA